ncbi:MAG: GIY-YIG nuclease family protein [Prochloraceae cyanobacterium]
MTAQTETSTLTNLDYILYLDKNGCLPENLLGKIGAYAIFNQDKILQYVGYSRDIYLSLKQHLVRQPDRCYWLKVQEIARPSRTVLEEIKQAWIEENGSIPPGNDSEKARWNQPIDAKKSMTEAEKEQYQQSEEIAQIKLLKKIARRVEEEIKEQLKGRGVQMEIRFNPKLKEQGLLDLK